MVLSLEAKASSRSLPRGKWRSDLGLLRLRRPLQTRVRWKPPLGREGVRGGGHVERHGPNVRRQRAVLDVISVTLIRTAMVWAGLPSVWLANWTLGLCSLVVRDRTSDARHKSQLEHGLDSFLSLSSTMFMSRVCVATVALLSLRSFVSASPLVARAVQGVWTPPVTAPKAGDVWTVGSTQLVSWKSDEIPPSAANNTGTLFLGYFDGYREGENLDIGQPNDVPSGWLSDGYR